MDYMSVKAVYYYKIRDYINRISSSMDVTAYTTGSKVISTQGYVTPGENTEKVISECMNDLHNAIAKDYPDESSSRINKVVNEIFENDVVPSVKQLNERNMKHEMTKSYWGNAFEEIISAAIFIGVIAFILWIFGVIK